MNPSPSKIQTDFDRIALLSSEGWDHNSHYHEFLLRHIPSSGSEALEIGCGTGVFSRLLAKRFHRVHALDLSPRMIEVAKERSLRFHNIDFQLADAMTYEFPVEQFDCVASIATLHHLPFEQILYRMKRTLKAGGTLLVLDLFQAESLSDIAAGLLAVPVNVALKLIRGGQLRESAQVRAAWAEHGRTETYLPLSQVRRVCATMLPGAQVQRHLLWRYSIVWKKAMASGKGDDKVRPDKC
jgi:ubiquinone/menaquinone biosynthesis C-methylase UbiE